jgi:hypothetical protein
LETLRSKINPGIQYPAPGSSQGQHDTQHRVRRNAIPEYDRQDGQRHRQDQLDAVKHGDGAFRPVPGRHQRAPGGLRIRGRDGRMPADRLQAARQRRRLRLADAIERHRGRRFGVQLLQKPGRLGVAPVAIGGDGRRQQSEQRHGKPIRA